MKLLFFLILIYIPVLKSHAQSSPCAEVRLDRNNGSMSKLPREPYRQYDLNHCYAVTAAQMIDAYRFSHGDTQTSRFTSSLDLSRRYKATIRKSNYEMIKTLAKNKDAYLKSISQEHYDHVVQSYWRQNPVLIYPVEKYSQDIIDFGFPDDVFTKLIKNGRMQTCDYEAADKFLAGSAGLQYTNANWRKQQPMRDVGYPGATCSFEQSNYVKLNKSINDALVKTNYEEFFGDMMAKVCEGHQLSIQMPSPLIYQVDTSAGKKESSRQQIAKRMRVAFDLKNPQPVAVSYCMEILSGTPANYPEQCKFAHASVVMGRRPGPSGKCEYLIRNSTTKCLYNSKDCKDGEHWVNEDILLSGTMNMSVIVDETAKPDFERRFAN